MSSVLQTNPNQPLAVWYYNELLRTTRHDGYFSAMEAENDSRYLPPASIVLLFTVGSECRVLI